MNKNYSNKNRMFQTVAEVVETNRPIWALVAIFVAIFNEYKALLARIMTTAQAAGVDLKGVTGGKNNTLDALGSMLFEVCSNLAIFAVRTKNTTLHAKVFLPEYAIKRKKDVDLLIFANEVLALVNQYKAELTDYDIDDAYILELTELIALANTEMPVPGAKYTDKQTAYAELEKLFKETDDFLEFQLDKAVDGIRKKSATFYTAYYFARNIKNIGIRHDPPPPPTPPTPPATPES